MPQPSLRQFLPEPLPSALPGTAAPGVVVAITAEEAAAEIGACLMALAGQRNAHGLRLAPGAFGVLLLVHGRGDDTAWQARALAPRLPFPLLVREAPPPADAGRARRLALESAADWLDRAARPDGVMWDPLESTCRHASLSIL